MSNKAAAQSMSRRKYSGHLMQVRIEPQIEPEIRRWAIAQGRSLQAEVNRALFIYYSGVEMNQPLAK